MITALFKLINNWIIFVISNQFVVAVVFGRNQKRTTRQTGLFNFTRLMQVKVEKVRLETPSERREEEQERELMVVLVDSVACGAQVSTGRDCWLQRCREPGHWKPATKSQIWEKAQITLRSSSLKWRARATDEITWQQVAWRPGLLQVLTANLLQVCVWQREENTISGTFIQINKTIATLNVGWYL